MYLYAKKRLNIVILNKICNFAKIERIKNNTEMMKKILFYLLVFTFNTLLFAQDYVHTYIEQTICNGETIQFGGNTITAMGIYNDTLQTVNGQDSIVTLALTVVPQTEHYINAIICQGTEYSLNNKSYSAAGIYYDTLQSFNGCDSIIILNLITNNTFDTIINATICNGETYTQNGFNLSTSGVYTKILPSIDCCDSIITLNLTVLGNANGDWSNIYSTDFEDAMQNTKWVMTSTNSANKFRINNVTGNNTILYFGKALNDTTYSKTTKVNASAITTLPPSSSDSLKIEFDLNSAGESANDYLKVMILPQDSNINLPNNGANSGIIAASYSTYVMPYNNKYYINLTNGQKRIVGQVTNPSIDDSTKLVFIWHNDHSSGADPAAVIDNIIIKEKGETIFDTICSNETYELPSGTEVTSSGFYIDAITTSQGCVSVSKYDITVLQAYDTTIYINLCGENQYDENGFNVTESGIYTQNLQTINGCDSIVKLDINFYESYNTTLYDTICEGQSFTEYGFNANTNGVFSKQYTTVNGCDSSFVLNLVVNPRYNDTINITICNGTTYDFDGQIIDEAGIYSKSYQSIKGCDSVVVLNLQISNQYETSIAASICSGEEYIFDTDTLTLAGTYEKNYISLNGCDSVVTLVLSVNQPSYNIINQDICEGSSYTFGEEDISQGGIYFDTLTNVLGCDSIVALILNLIPNATTDIQTTICGGHTYEFAGEEISTSGVYIDTLSTENGCDSIVTLYLTVNTSYEVELYDTITEGESYVFGGQIIETDGVYTDTLYSITNCDSVVVLHLTVLASGLMDIDAETQISLYPNPTKNIVTLHTNKTIPNDEVLLLDNLGKVIRRINTKVKKQEENFDIDLTELDSGIYYLKIGDITKKIIKQ